MKIAASWAKLLVGLPKKIFVPIEKISKANLLTPQQLIVTLLLPIKTRSKATKSWVISNALLVTKSVITLTSIPAENQKTSISLAHFRVNDWGY